MTLGCGGIEVASVSTQGLRLFHIIAVRVMVEMSRDGSVATLQSFTSVEFW